MTARSSVAVALVGLCSAGCVTFSDLPGAAPRHRGQPPFEKLLVFIDSGYDPLEASGRWIPQPTKAHERHAIDALGKSGWVRKIHETTERSTANLELRLERYRALSSVGSLTLLSLGLFPSRWELSLKLKLTRFEAGKTPETCVRIQHYHQWGQLFLAPLMVRRSARSYEARAVGRFTLQCGKELFALFRRGSGLPGITHRRRAS